MSQYPNGPTTPSSQKSNRQLGYDTPSVSAPLLHSAASQETPGPARFVSPPPANPGSRPGTAAGGPSTAIVPRPGTSQTIHPERRSTSQSGTYWGPLPRSYTTESFEYRRPALENRNSYNEYETLNAQPPMPMSLESDETQAVDPVPRAHRQASIDPIPTQVTTIPANEGSPVHRRPSDSFRSLRYDTKKRSYRFDNLSDIESEGVRGPRPGSFYNGGRSTPVEEILRLPLTWWMNSTAKNREFNSKCTMIQHTNNNLQTLSQ